MRKISIQPESWEPSRNYEQIIAIESELHLWFALEFLLKKISPKNCLLVISSDISNLDSYVINNEFKTHVIRKRRYSPKSTNDYFSFGLELKRILFEDNEYNFNEIILFKCSFAAKLITDYSRQIRQDLQNSLIFIDLGPTLNSSPDIYLFETYKFTKKILAEMGCKAKNSLNVRNDATLKTPQTETKIFLEFLVIDEFGLTFVMNFLSTLDDDKDLGIDNNIEFYLHTVPSLNDKFLKKYAKNNEKFLAKNSNRRDRQNSVFVIAGNWRESLVAYAKLMNMFTSEIILVDNCKSSLSENEIFVNNVDSYTFNVNEIKDAVKFKLHSLASNYKKNNSTIETGFYSIGPFLSAVSKKRLKKVNKNATFGVAILHHRRPALLLEALNSVLAQTRLPDEIKIFDDGSFTEDVTKVFEEIKRNHPNIKILIQENRYLGALRNFAVKNMETDIVYFLDDDNILNKHALETIESVYKNTGADIIGSYSIPFNEDDVVDFSQETKIMFGGIAGFSTLRKNFICDGNCMVDREFFLKIGGNSELYGIGSDDHEFFQKSFLSGARIEIISEPLYGARQMRRRLRNTHFSRSTNLKMMRVSNSLYSANNNLEIDPILFYNIVLRLDESAFFYLGQSKRKLLRNTFMSILALGYLMIPRRVKKYFGNRFFRRYWNFILQAERKEKGYNWRIK